MKKKLFIILSLVLVASLLATLAACGGNGGTEPETEAPATEPAAESELAAVKAAGKLVVGITEFEPMDYQKDGEWVGFDADVARAFAASIGVEVEFSVINWDTKVEELNGKTIDCVWNGMTLTDEVKAAMECSNAYCNNQQIVIVKADAADQYKTAEDCKDLQFAVESGSAGQEQAEAYNFQFTEVLDQATALQEVEAGTCDAAIIDSLMAAAMVGEGTGYEDLTYTVGLNDEEYGVGFRTGSDLAAALNDFLAASYADGSLQKIAETYGVQASLIAQ